jgi:hypothetical protein
MNRLLKSASWSFSLLAVLCLVLGLLAMPTAMVRADEPAGPLAPSCGGYGANGCTWDNPEDCILRCPNLGGTTCKCIWGGPIGDQKCGCFVGN